MVSKTKIKKKKHNKNILSFDDWIKSDGKHHEDSFEKYQHCEYINYYSEKMLYFIEQDDIDSLKDIIKSIEDFDINKKIFEEFNKCQFKNTLLHQTLVVEADNSINKKNSEIKILKYLIDNGADVNLYNLYGETPLLVFLRYSSGNNWGEKPKTDHNEKIVKLLLDSGADPNIAEEHSFQSPLTYGIRQGISMIEMLISYGADVNKAPIYTSNSGSYKYTVYRAAFNCNHNKSFDCVLYLIVNCGFDPFIIHKSLLFSGSEHSDGNFFDYFCKDIEKGNDSMAEYLREKYKGLYSYEFQKLVCEKYTEHIREFIDKVKIINDDVREEYAYLFDADDLGLL